MDYAIRISGLALGLVCTILVGSLYAPNESAKFFTAYSIGAIASIALKFGLDDFIVKHNSTHDATGKVVASGKVFKISCIFAGISAISLTLFVFQLIIGYEASSEFFGAFMLSVAMTASAINGAVFQSSKKFRLAAIISAVLPQAAIILFLPIIGKADPYFALYAGSALVTAVNILIFTHRILQKRLELNDVSIIEIIGESKVYLMSGASTQILVHSPVVLSGFLMDYEFTSDLAVSTRISQTLLILIALANFRLAPEVRGLFVSGDMRGVVNTYKIYSRLTNLSLLIFSALILISYASISSSSYFSNTLRIPSNFIFFAIFVGYFTNAACGPVSATLTMIDKHRVVSNITFFVLILSLTATSVSMIFLDGEWVVIAIALGIAGAKLPLIFVFKKYITAEN